jgi:hypothetical protein
MTFTGTWRITGMVQWDQEAYDLMGPAFFRFDRGGTGHFRFIAVEGQMDCRYSKREGCPFVEFTWEGNDECDRASGRGWARIEQDDTLLGHIFFHLGDDSSFTAIRGEKAAKASRPRSRTPARRERR